MTRLAVLLIRLYQVAISPWIGARCIYTPSCSQYAIDAYRKRGFWRGSTATLARLLRCGPWRAGGADPVR